jgi:hypothetical protein
VPAPIPRCRSRWLASAARFWCRRRAALRSRVPQWRQCRSEERRVQVDSGARIHADGCVRVRRRRRSGSWVAVGQTRRAAHLCQGVPTTTGEAESNRSRQGLPGVHEASCGVRLRSEAAALSRLDNGLGLSDSHVAKHSSRNSGSWPLVAREGTVTAMAPIACWGASPRRAS